MFEQASSHVEPGEPPANAPPFMHAMPAGQSFWCVQRAPSFVRSGQTRGDGRSQSQDAKSSQRTNHEATRVTDRKATALPRPVRIRIPCGGGGRQLHHANGRGQDERGHSRFQLSAEGEHAAQGASSKWRRSGAEDTGVKLRGSDGVMGRGGVRASARSDGGVRLWAGVVLG